MNYKEINDYEQLYLIYENDDDAKQVMYKKYKPIVVSLANKYYRLLLNAGIDIDDLIQEGYIGLSSAINSFKETANVCFYTFCVICIERQIRSYCKKYTSNKNMILNTAYSIDNQQQEEKSLIVDISESKYSINNPDIYVSNLFHYTKCIQFKHTLSLKDSLIFELRYNGFKYKEISTLLDISINCVDNSIHKTKDKFLLFLNK